MSETTDDDRPALNSVDVCNRLGIGYTTLQWRIKHGQFPKADFYLGTRQKWHRATFDAYMRDAEAKAKAKHAAQAPPPSRKKSGKGVSSTQAAEVAR